jgi:putative hydrolase of the HAD superfamily
MERNGINIIFDLGRVMIRIADNWREACEFAGVEYRDYDNNHQAQDGRNAAEDALERGEISFDEMAERFRQSGDGAYSVDEIKKIYLSIINDEFAGMADFVSSLQNRGYLTACLSNTCDAHWEQFLHSGRYPAIEMLDEHFASHLLGVRKPEEVIYRKVMKLLGAAGKDIIFFDDRPDNVAGAMRCGWNVMQIMPGKSSIEQMRYYISRFEKNTKNL